MLVRLAEGLGMVMVTVADREVVVVVLSSLFRCLCLYPTMSKTIAVMLLASGVCLLLRYPGPEDPIA